MTPSLSELDAVADVENKNQKPQTKKPIKSNFFRVGAARPEWQEVGLGRGYETGVYNKMLFVWS